MHIPFTPLAVYFDNQYITNKYAHHIRRLVFQKIANEFIKKKNNWSKRTSRNIEWELHYKNINKRNEHSYQVKVKFIHSRLPSGKMNFATKHTCPFCKITDSSSTPDNNFLQCNQSHYTINNWINKITKIM